MWFFLLSLEGNSIFFQWRLYTFQVFVAWKCILYIWLPLMGFLRAEQWPVLLNLTDPSLGYNTKVVYSVRPLWKIQSFHDVLHVLRRQFLSEYITYNFVWLNLIFSLYLQKYITHLGVVSVLVCCIGTLESVSFDVLYLLICYCLIIALILSNVLHILQK